MSDKSSSMGKDFILFASKASRLIENEKIEQAMSLCEAGVRNFPFYSPGHFVLGLCYEFLGRNDEAKNEYERTLVYDPSHLRAMRKLSEISESSGLQQISNEWLIRESLYNPMDQSLIEILKEKNLYQLNLMQGDEEAISETASIEEKVSETAELEVESNEPNTQEAELDEPKIVEAAEDKVDNELAAVEEKETEEQGLIDDLDPLAENVEMGNGHSPAFSEEENPAEKDLNQYANTEDDFSTIMDGYFDSEEEEQSEENDEWIEVENLLIDEEESNVTAAAEDADPETLVEADAEAQNSRDETELLLEQLSDLSTDETMPVSSKDEKKVADPLPSQQEKASDESPIDTLTESEKLLVPEIDDDEETAAENETVLEPLPDIPAEPTIEEFKPSEIGSDEEVTIKDLMENPNLVTPTFGEILVSQRKFSEARHIFMELLKKEPDNLRFLKKVEFLDKFLAAQKA